MRNQTLLLLPLLPPDFFRLPPTCSSDQVHRLPIEPAPVEDQFPNRRPSFLPPPRFLQLARNVFVKQHVPLGSEEGVEEGRESGGWVGDGAENQDGEDGVDGMGFELSKEEGKFFDRIGEEEDLIGFEAGCESGGTDTKEKDESERKERRESTREERDEFNRAHRIFGCISTFGSRAIYFSTLSKSRYPIECPVPAPKSSTTPVARLRMSSVRPKTTNLFSSSSLFPPLSPPSLPSSRLRLPPTSRLPSIISDLGST